MIRLELTRERAEYLIGCMIEGRPIGPTVVGEWSETDLLTAAGILVAAVLASNAEEFSIRVAQSEDDRELALGSTISAVRGYAAMLLAGVTDDWVNSFDGGAWKWVMTAKPKEVAIEANPFPKEGN